MTTILNHPLVDHRMTLMRDQSTPPKLFRELVNEITDIQVVHTEIVPPCREAVGLIYHKANNMASHQQTLNGLATQHFWSDIEQIGCSVSHLFDSSCPFDRV